MTASVPTRGGAQEQAARGVDLMAQRDNLLYHAAHAYEPESRAQAIATLDAWDAARTDADWEAIRVATFGAGKAKRLRMIMALEDVAPIGQRR